MSEQACHHRQVELRTVAACGADSAVLWLIAWDACCTASHAAHCMACSAESSVLWLLACGNVANCCRLQAVASAQAAAISVQHVCYLSSGSSQSEPGRLNPCLAVAVAGVLQVLSLGSFTCTWPAAVAAVSSAGQEGVLLGTLCTIQLVCQVWVASAPPALHCFARHCLQEVC